MDRFKEISDRDGLIGRLVPYSNKQKEGDYRWLLEDKLKTEFEVFEIYTDCQNPRHEGLLITFTVTDKGNKYHAPVFDNLDGVMPSEFVIMVNKVIEQVKQQIEKNNTFD